MSFPRYPEYKDSGVAWLGEVPAHWNVKRLKHNLRLLTEKTDRRANPVALENIEGWSGRFLPTETEFEGEGIAFDKGDILFGKLRPYLAKALLAETAGEAVGDFHVMRPQAGVHARFAQYEILNRSFIDIVDGSTFGSKMPRASWEFVGSMALPTPPFLEQVAIATFLDRETAKIDALVAEQEKLIALLQEKRQAVISHAVTKGLDPNVPMKDSGVEWLGEVPGHWEVSQLRYVVREGTSITYGIVQAGPEVEDGVPYIRTSDMSGNALPLTGYPKTSLEIDASYARSKVNAGDLVISIRASVGKCLPVPPELDGANLTQGTAKIAPGGKAPAAFMLPFISSEPIQLYLDSKAKGATFKEITLETLRKTPFLVPPLEEQLRIAKWVSDQDQQFQALIDAAEQAQKLLRERRTALISAAVTGQIDVRGMFSKEVNA